MMELRRTKFFEHLLRIAHVVIIYTSKESVVINIERENQIITDRVYRHLARMLKI
jgi:hypothetical protein